MFSISSKRMMMFKPKSRAAMRVSGQQNDSGPHFIFITLSGIFMLGCAVYGAKTIFNHAFGWERASMPTRQQRAEMTISYREEKIGEDIFGK